MTEKRPHDDQAERNAAGCILNGFDFDRFPNLWGLEGTDFHNLQLGEIVGTAQALRRAGRPVNFDTVAGALHPAQDDAFLAGLVHDIDGLTVETSARIVKRDGSRRQTMDALRAAYRQVETGADPAAQLAKLQAVIPAEKIHKADPAWLTADDLLTRDWPEPTWAVPDLLPVGLTILAGKPKVGKSWMDLQLAFAIASGGMFLGHRVEKRPVLYCALEDPDRRLANRMKLQRWPRGLPVKFLTLGSFFEQIGDLRNGGGERLARAIEVEGFGAVLIDTVSRATPSSTDQNDLGAMTGALEPAQVIAQKQNCALVMTDHHSSHGLHADPDPIRDIIASTAKGAMLDTAIGLYREQGKAGATLSLTGRDIEAQSVPVWFDKDTYTWQPEGEAQLTSRQQEVVSLVRTIGAATYSQIVEGLGEGKGNVYERLQDLCANGKLQRVGVGKGTRYVVPTSEPTSWVERESE